MAYLTLNYKNNDIKAANFKINLPNTNIKTLRHCKYRCYLYPSLHELMLRKSGKKEGTLMYIG
jgi:hypothetical protein